MKEAANDTIRFNQSLSHIRNAIYELSKSKLRYPEFNDETGKIDDIIYLLDEIDTGMTNVFIEVSDDVKN